MNHVLEQCTIPRRYDMNRLDMFKLNTKLNKPISKDSFLIALREVAPEMELFLENHGEYTMKNYVIKLNNIWICTFRHLTKKLYLEKYAWKDIPPHFFAENLSQTLL